METTNFLVASSTLCLTPAAPLLRLAPLKNPLIANPVEATFAEITVA